MHHSEALNSFHDLTILASLSWSVSIIAVLGVASRRGVVVRNFGVKHRVPNERARIASE